MVWNFSNIFWELFRPPAGVQTRLEFFLERFTSVPVNLFYHLPHPGPAMSCVKRSRSAIRFFLKSFFFFSGFLSRWFRGWKRFPGTGNGVSHCSTCYPCTALNRDGTF